MSKKAMQEAGREARRIMADHEVSLKTGFLAEKPLQFLPRDRMGNAKRHHDFITLDALAHYPLHKLISGGNVEKAVSKLTVPEWAFDDLPRNVVYRLMLIYAMLTHGYFREMFPYKNVGELMQDESVKHLPPQLAVPLWKLSRITGIAPTMSYDLYGLQNWRKIDLRGPMELGNVEMIHSFTGTHDENWFVAVHHIVELEAAVSTRELVKADRLAWIAFDPGATASEVSDDDMISCLNTAANAERRAVDTLKRMYEHCDQRTYFDSVRLFYSFPINVVFDGVDELQGEPQNYFGETGGQSPSRHLRVVALGIEHKKSGYFTAMRAHMSRAHRSLLEHMDNSRIRTFVLNRRSNQMLVSAYNETVLTIVDWRTEHNNQVTAYIREHGNESHGTGKPPLEWLIELRDETIEHLIK